MADFSQIVYYQVDFLQNFLFLVTVDILVGGRGHRTQFWKGTTKGPFHRSLVQIGPVASEELIKMWKVIQQKMN
jgi:hypothetical protein